MTFQYFLVETDGTASICESASREQFLHEDADLAVGVGGATRVRLYHGWMMTGYVNDCGLLRQLPRNVVGGVLLGVLGAGQQPYAGPVVVCGWDTRATYMGQLEVQGLTPPFVEALERIVADIRIVLGMDEGTPSRDDPAWAADVRTFADYIRDGEAPAMRVVSGDDAVKHVLDQLRGREGL